MVEDHRLRAIKKFRRTVVSGDKDDGEEKDKDQRIHGQNQNRAQGQQSHRHAEHEQRPQPPQDEVGRKAAEEERGDELKHLCCFVVSSVGCLLWYLVVPRMRLITMR